jgi:hypothetical protein
VRLEYSIRLKVSLTVRRINIGITFDEEGKIYFADIANATVFSLNSKNADNSKLLII